MTTKYLTNAYPTGYELKATYSELVVDAGAYVGGSGIRAAAAVGIQNLGTVNANDYKNRNFDSPGIDLLQGGFLVNGSTANTGALIEGNGSGVVAYAAATEVANYGTIQGRDGAGVALSFGGIVINGSSADTTAMISGSVSGVSISNATAAIDNYGTIQGGIGGCILLTAGGAVTNGSNIDTSALIESVSASGVAATVTNYGAIQGGIGYAVVLAAGGAVTNGSNIDTTALIQGLSASGASATVVNCGTIQGGGGSGVFLSGGGSVTNGSASDTTALIGGGVGASDAPITVTNNGTIQGGVFLSAGGTVINGSSSDTTALIGGAIATSNAAATVTNHGTIQGGSGAGIFLSAGGIVINGSSSDTTALIRGGIAASNATATIANYGTINGGFGVGVDLAAGGSLINGSSSDTTALIQGGIAASNAAATITNYGTIPSQDLSGYGVDLFAGGTVTNGSASDVMALIAGGVSASTIPATINNFGTIQDQGNSLGVRLGAGGTVTNGSATDTTAIIEGYSAGVIVSGGQATVINYGTIVGAGGAGVDAQGTAVEFTSAGGLLVVGAGSVFNGAVLGGGGTLDLATGAGTITGLRGGYATVSGSMPTTVFTNFGTIEVGANASFVAPGGGYGMSLIDAGTLAVDGTLRADGYSTITGTLTGPGKAVFTGGLDLNGATLMAANTLIEMATVTLSGAITVSGVLHVAGSQLDVSRYGASLTGGGAVHLKDISADNNNFGYLTNVDDRITGGGLLGCEGLINDAGGIISDNDATALTIDAFTVINAGTINATGAGGVIIDCSVDNAGILAAHGGNLTVEGGVSGSGHARIDNGTLFFASSFSENVVFNGVSGVLELAFSQTYTGSIRGFSTSGSTSLDLDDIAFGRFTKVRYHGTTTSGVLTVTDGSHTARIRLIGDYLGAGFQTASDGHGGVVVKTITTAAHAPPVQAFVATMAGLIAGTGTGIVAHGHDQASRPMLLGPRAQTA